MKMLKYYLIFAACITVFLATTAYFPDVKKGDSNTESVYASDKKRFDNSKIIKFDHKLHSVDAEIKCEDCHVKAKNSVSSKDNLNPSKKECEACHDVNNDKECNLCHYDNVYKKLRASNSEMLFSHKQHAANKKCTDCHKDLDKVKFSAAAASGFPSMESCYTCHNDNTATSECAACHTNLTNLIPKDHNKPNFLNEHTTVAGVSTSNQNCAMCHSDNFCQVCHSAKPKSGNNTTNDFYAPYYTRDGATRIDREDLQKLTTAHDLNYRFTHGVDAGQKTFECNTCHDPVNFCASCHLNGGEALTGAVPESHRQPNFTTLGVNTGGGIHADIARRDIEKCQSCHDVQGADPACLKCHFDNDGIKGTNPKTHETGFMSDDNGYWHTSQGANCYTCHTDANARPNGISGVGFCGYCHGGGQDR
ncbi:MAG: cytochrome C [Ignavibacteria bacterium]|nr:cytochrome C [Ignavibacteria bacterium]